MTYNVKLFLTEQYEATIEADGIMDAEKKARALQIGCVEQFERSPTKADYRLEITDPECLMEDYIEVGECDDEGDFQYSLPNSAFQD